MRVPSPEKRRNSPPAAVALAYFKFGEEVLAESGISRATQLYCKVFGLWWSVSLLLVHEMFSVILNR